jgi:hypothetical protein
VSVGDCAFVGHFLAETALCSATGVEDFRTENLLITSLLLLQAPSVPPLKNFIAHLAVQFRLQIRLQWNLFANRLPGKYSTLQDI